MKTHPEFLSDIPESVDEERAGMSTARCDRERANRTLLPCSALLFPALHVFITAEPLPCQYVTCTQNLLLQLYQTNVSQTIQSFHHLDHPSFYSLHQSKDILFNETKRIYIIQKTA